MNWPKSQWCHLHEMCKREQICLIKQNDVFHYTLKVDEDVTVRLSHPSAFYAMYKQRELKTFESQWSEKSSQGRIIRETDSKANNILSANFIRNHKLTDEIRSFVCRGRLQLLQRESLLALYYPGNYSKSCKICHNPYDTVSHILNGCTQYQGLYQQRHNRIVDIIFGKANNANTEVVKDTVLKPAMFNSPQQHFLSQNTRPDLVLIDREEQRATIVEIAVPFDAHIDICYKSKFEKYFPLSQELNNLGFKAEIIVLIIGSLGTVHFRFLSGLKKMNIPKAESKHLARYLSISAIIGSYRVWKQRCKHYIYR